jgi:exopolysaccharide biosynthesis polyprenyl glycosylphosphotransferase
VDAHQLRGEDQTVNGTDRGGARATLDVHQPDEVPPALLTRLNAHGFRLVQLADLLMLALVLVATMFVRYRWSWPTYSMRSYLWSFVVVLVVFLAALYFGGMYEREPRLGAPPALPRAARHTPAAGGLVALANLVATGAGREFGWLASNRAALALPVPNLVGLIVLGAVGVAVNRRAVTMLRTYREGPPKVLLVGTEEEVATAHEHLGTDVARARVVGSTADPARLVEEARATGATDVMLLSSRWLDHISPDVLVELEAVGVAALQRVTARETMFGLERIRQVGGLPFVVLRPHAMQLSRLRFKRFTDLVILSLLAPVLLPLLVAVAVYVRLAAGRPILFWQTRVGAGGRPFQMVKFRTMRPDAEEDGNARLATQDDPRIIPACRVLRSTRMDELPQLWNVVRGEMSLIGPRPERPELTAEFERIIPGYRRRHEIPPGLTGLAQIHGRYHTDPEYKLGYDLQYVVNWSPVLDLEILARTVWVVLARRI